MMGIKKALPYVVAIASMMAVTVVYLPLHHLIQGKPGTVAFTDVIVVLLIAMKWGTGPAIVASAVGVVTWDFFYLPPYFSVKITDLRLEDTVLLVAFMITSVVVGQLSARARQRTEEAEAGRRKIEALYSELQQENSERKRVEEALLRSKEYLELRVRERTQELTRSNADLEQFAYVASHDLQEPLRMVTSYLQLLEQRYKSKLDAQADEFIGFAVDGAKRMQSLISDLLSYSRVGMKGAPFERTDCEEVLAAALKNLQFAIEESGAQITHDPLPIVMSDSIQLMQLFQNLLANSIKFRSSRSPQIQIDIKAEDGFWRFSFRDNGIGIASEHFDRIFALFQRLSGRGRYPGTGIGLAICKKIVERHGGCIWVESEIEHGSTFFFTIPKEKVMR